MKFSALFLFSATALALPNPSGYFTNSTTPTLQGRAQPSASPLQGRALPSTAPLLSRYVSTNNTINVTASANTTAIKTSSLTNATVLERPTFSRGNLTTPYYSRLRALRLQRIHQAQASNSTVGKLNSTALNQTRVVYSTASLAATTASASTSPRFLPQALQPGIPEHS
jgi:hypothetical protein